METTQAGRISNIKPLPYAPVKWGGYKGHVRGLFRGLLLGATIGVLAGIGFVALAALTGFAAPLIGAMSIGLGAQIIAGFTAATAFITSEILGKVGDTAGQHATVRALKELSMRYPEPLPIGPDSPDHGFGHHYETLGAKDANKPKLISNPTSIKNSLKRKENLLAAEKI